MIRDTKQGQKSRIIGQAKGKRQVSVKHSGAYFGRINQRRADLLSPPCSGARNGNLALKVLSSSVCIHSSRFLASGRQEREGEF